MYKTNPRYILNSLGTLKDYLNSYLSTADEIIPKIKAIDGSPKWFTIFDNELDKAQIYSVMAYVHKELHDCDHYLDYRNARGVQKCMNNIDIVRHNRQEYVTLKGDPTDTEQTRSATNVLLNNLIEIVRPQVIRKDLQA